MKNLSRAGFIALIVLMVAIIGIEAVVTKSLFVLKDRMDSFGTNASVIRKGSNDDVGKLSEQISALAKRVDNLEYKGETAGSWKYSVDNLESEITELRMDTNTVPQAPKLISDGEMFSLKLGNATIITTPCGGGSGPEADEFRIRTSTTGPSLVLNKITKTPKGYKLDVTFGGYRHTVDYNPEDYEYQQANSDWDIIYSGPKEEEKDLFGPIVKILRVNFDKIFVIAQRRAC